MFGISAYAAAPYASLANVIYAVSISEAASVSDSIGSIGDLYANISEAASVADSISGG